MKLLFENWRNYTQLNEEQLLIEGRIDDAKRKYPELAEPREELDGESLLDTFIQADPSGNQKYLMGMAKMLNNTIQGHVAKGKKVFHGKLWPEEDDNYKNFISPWGIAKNMANYLEKFHKLQSFIRDQDKPFKDINNIKNFKALQSVVTTAERKKEDIARAKLQKGRASQQAKEESRTIEETEGYIIIRPETTHASCFYGKGTKWCISAEMQNAFEDYTNEGKAFYFIFLANLPNDDQSKKLALVIDTAHGEFEAVYDAQDHQVGGDGLKLALTKNLLNLKKYPAAYEWMQVGGPDDLEKSELDYDQAMDDLGMTGLHQLQSMVGDQTHEMISLAVQDANDNPAGPNEEEFLELLESYDFNYIKVEYVFPWETGSSVVFFEANIFLDLEDIVAASPDNLSWKEEHDADDATKRYTLGRVMWDAFARLNIRLEEVDVPHGREFRVTIERSSGNIDDFRHFLEDAKYYEETVADGQLAQALRDELQEAGFVSRSEREEHYWPDPGEKEKQLELPLQEIFRGWREFIK